MEKRGRSCVEALVADGDGYVEVGVDGFRGLEGLGRIPLGLWVGGMAEGDWG